MKKVFLVFLFSTLVFLGKNDVSAQLFSPQEKPCDISAEEILSVIKSVYNLQPSSDKVLTVGEIQAGYLQLSKEPISVFRAVAMVGALSRNASFRLYLIRQSADGKTKSKLEIDLRNIKKGLAKDVLLENGDVIFVSRGCRDGKLLPPSKRVILPKPGGGTDEPQPITNKPIGK